MLALKYTQFGNLGKCTSFSTTEKVLTVISELYIWLLFSLV